MKYFGYLILGYCLSVHAGGLGTIFENNHGLPGENIKPGA